MEILDDEHEGNFPAPPTPAATPYTWIGDNPSFTPGAGIPQPSATAAGFETDLGTPDRPSSAAQPAPAEPEKAAESEPPAARVGLFGVLMSAETLGLTGVLAAICSTLSAIPQFLVIADTQQSARLQLEHYFTFVAGGAGISVLLGVAGLTRLRTTSSGFARASCGAAVLLGLLLLVVASWGILHANGSTGPTNNF